MFRLSTNLVTALFGIIAALGTILGIGSLTSANKIVQRPSGQLTQELDPNIAATPDTAGLTITQRIAQSITRQVGQNAPGASSSQTTTSATTSATTTTADGSVAQSTSQNPSAPFVVQGEGAVLTSEPAPPATPSEATAVELDPSPGVAATSTPAPAPSSPEPVAQAPAESAPASAPASPPRTPTPAPAPTPVRAMW